MDGEKPSDFLSRERHPIESLLNFIRFGGVAYVEAYCTRTTTLDR